MGTHNKIAQWWTSPNVVLWCFRICLYTSLLSVVLSATDMKVLLTGYDLRPEHRDYPFMQIRIGFLAWVAFHHIVGALLHFPALVDAIFVGIDIPVMIVFNYPIKVILYDRKVLLVNVASAWILFAMLCFTFVGRVFIIRNLIAKKEGPFRLFYISGQSIRSMQSFVSMFMGRSIAKTRISGEGIFIRSLRSIFALVLIFGMGFYALQNLFLAPLTESIVAPVKELRAQSLPWDTTSDIMDLGWNIVLMRAIADQADRTELVDQQSFANGALNLTSDILNFNDTQTFHDAVTITPLWDRGMLDHQPPCVHQPGEAQILPYMVARGMYPLNQFISIRCPSRPSRPEFEGRIPIFDALPDLLIQINYTALGIATYTSSNQWLNVVQIFAGLVEKDVDVVRHTKPFSVPSNVNQLVEMNWLFRETFKSRATSSLGIFDSSSTFAIGDIVQILPDPLTSATEFSPVQRIEHTSTVRLFTTIGPGDLKIIQDSREKSVLAGFSSVGGLWSFLDGIFAFFFGLTVFAIVFESKPLSIFGFVHGWRKGKLAHKYFKKYPELQKDINLPRREGLMAYLQDNYIDLDPFMDTEDVNGDKEEISTCYAPDSVDLGRSMHGVAEQGSFLSIGGTPGGSMSKLGYPPGNSNRAEEHMPLTPNRFQ